MNRNVAVGTMMLILAALLSSCGAGSSGSVTTVSDSAAAVSDSAAAVSESAAAVSESAAAVSDSAAAVSDSAAAVSDSADAEPVVPEGKAAIATAQAAGKPYVLWFWSAFCTDCQLDSASVAAASREFGDSVPIIGVPSPQDSAEARAEFIAELDAPVPQVGDGALEIWVENTVASTPTVIYVDAAGNTKTQVGPIFPKAFSEQLKTLVNDPNALA